jgi:hypothetical protein
VNAAPRPGVLARYPGRITAAALFAMVVLLFAPAVFGGRVFFQRDIHAYWHPHVENAVQAVAEGGWPTWTPYVAFGRPLLADPSLQLVYPPTWLNLLVRPSVYYTLFAVGHVWAAGVGAYALARGLGVGALGAALAGAAYASSGPLLSAVNLFHHFAGAAWMPWVLVMVERALRAPTRGRALALGAVAAGQALAGSADLCLLTGAAASLRALRFVAAGGGPLRRRVAGPALAGATALALAAGLGAVQWVPALALLRQGVRASQNVLVSSAWSVHPVSLADLLVPRLVGELPLGPAWRMELFDGRGPLLASLYLGAASVPLVALALGGGAHPLRGWAALSLAFFLLAALGRHTLLYPVIASFPPFSLLRYPAKYMLPAALFWALLAGRGLDVWSALAAERRRTVVAAATGSLLLAGILAAAVLLPALAAARAKLWTSAALLAVAAAVIAWPTRSPAARGLVAAAAATIAVADLALAGRDVNPLAARALADYRPPVVADMLLDAREPRVYVRQETADRMNELLVRGPGGWDSEEGWTLGTQDLMVPPAGARWRIAGSYDGDFTGLAAPALSVFSYVLPSLETDPLGVRLLQMGAVTHVTSLRERPFAGLQPRKAFPSVFFVPVRLFTVPDPLPRVYAVGGARVAADDIVIRAINDPTFDPRREVVLPPGSAVHPPPEGWRGVATVAGRRMDRLGIEVETSGPAWLVVVEAWEPGWRALLDGREADVLRANGLFRAVAIPAAGRHRVELTYVPPGLRTGVALTTVAAAAGLVAAAWPRGGGPAHERARA